MRARSDQRKQSKEISSEERSSRSERREAELSELTEGEEPEAEGVELEEEEDDGADTVSNRLYNTSRFCLVSSSALSDSSTGWSNSSCQEHIDISDVLRIERCISTQQAKEGSVPTRETIEVYYQQQMRASEGYGSHDAERRVTAGKEEHRPSCSTDEETAGPTEPVPKDSLPTETHSENEVEDRDPSEPQAAPDALGEPAKEYREPAEHGPEVSKYRPSREPRPRSSRSESVRSLWSSVASKSSDPDSQNPGVEQRVGPDSEAGPGSRTPGRSSTFLSDSVCTTCSLASRSQQPTANESSKNRTFYDAHSDASDRFYDNQPQSLQSCYASYNISAARSEAVCYLVIVLNHMSSASCLTSVLPVSVFLWGMSSVPRPSKTFWMTAIVYTEVSVVIKYFFQFGFFPFNQQSELDRYKPFHPPNILGVEKKEGYVSYDLSQSSASFHHRAILKCHGLWDQTVTMETCSHCQHHDQADSAHAAPSSRRRRRRGTRSSSTQQQSPAGSSNSTAQRLSRLDLSSKKSREVSIRTTQCTARRWMSSCQPVSHFFKALIQPEYSAVTDVYVLMFLADTVDFIIIIFGFWAFGKHSAAADITSSLSEDQVPEAFLVMVLIQFGTMVIDRASYSRKTVLGKLVFQVVSVLGIHFWMFFISPTVTERRFSHNSVAQLWYFVKCVYFGSSAYQIRSGYPTRVSGNFLTKSYNYVNSFSFQGFRSVPYSTESRAVMDWVWTETTSSSSSWICVEDIYAHCFVLKCWRESEKRYPQPRGQRKKKVVKYGMGGSIVLSSICIIWFPSLFMSLIKSVAGVVNRPLDVSVTITSGGFQPIFTMSAQQNQLKDSTEEDFASFISSYSPAPSALQFSEPYDADDVVVAESQGSSDSLWTISPPSRLYSIQVSGSNQFPLTVSWTVHRNSSSGAGAEVASGKHVTYSDDRTRSELIQSLNGSSSRPVVIPDVFPCFVRASSDSDAKPVQQSYSDGRYKDILSSSQRTANQSRAVQEWWIADQPASSSVPLGGGASSDDQKEAGLQSFVFSDKVSPPSSGFSAGYGIMGSYASVVSVIGKFVREFFSGISHSIMFEESPSVDRILKLCMDIFSVRETGESQSEEELYAKSIFSYRSPETSIKWTRS